MSQSEKRNLRRQQCTLGWLAASCQDAMIGGARSATTAAIRERKRTQGHAVLWTERGHGSLLRLSFGIAVGKSRAEARPLQQRSKKRQQRCPSEGLRASRRYKRGPKKETPRLEP